MALRFQAGCGCCGSTCATTVRVTGCNGAALGGATVEIEQAGSPVDSGTTDGSGNVTLSIPNAGTFDVIVSKPGTGYETKTQSLSLSCGGTTTIALAIDGNAMNTLILNSAGPCGGGDNPDDTIVFGAVPSGAHGTGNTQGWIGSKAFNIGGALGWNDYIYIFTKQAVGGYSLFAYTASGNITSGLAGPYIPSSCDPFSWGCGCGNQNKFGGTITS